MKNYLFLTAAVAGLSSSPALAEEAGAWVNELVVTANRGVTVSTAGSATRTATPIEEIPQSIQAINRTLIEDQDLRNVGDALVNVSGVSPQGQMELVLQSPKIRGFDSAYLIDGLPAYNLPASASDPGTLINVARVEVATEIFLSVATDYRSRPRKKIRSRPTTGRDPERKSGCDRGLRSRSGRFFFFLLFSPERVLY